MEAKSKDLKFKQKISEIRKHFNLSQDALAAKVGVSGSAIGLIEKGKSKSPSAEFLAGLVTELAINPAWLLGEGPMLAADTNFSKAPSYSLAPADASAPLSETPVVALQYVRSKARTDFSSAYRQRGPASDPFDTVLFRLPPGRTAADYAEALVFDIEGDNLEPSLRDGQQVIVWPVPPSKWEHLHSTICVVAYAETVTVKAILKNELFDRDILALHATSRSGGSFTVARQAIHAIWEVREFYGVVPVRLL